MEALQLSTLERLEPALALYLIIAWRIQYLTLLGGPPPTCRAMRSWTLPNGKPSMSRFTTGRCR